MEVCDPSEAGEFGYAIDGIAVSDFYTPHFFDPVSSSGARYSFTGAIKKPRQVLKGGYLSWRDPVSDHWWQEVFFGAKAQFRDLGPLSQMQDGGIRAAIYRKTPEAFKVRAPAEGHAETARSLLQAATTAANSKASLLRPQIDALLRGE